MRNNSFSLAWVKVKRKRANFLSLDAGLLEQKNKESIHLNGVKIFQWVQYKLAKPWRMQETKKATGSDPVYKHDSTSKAGRWNHALSLSVVIGSATTF